MASSLRLTDHALRRMAQRNISASDLDWILAIGSEVEDGFLVRQKDCEAFWKAWEEEGWLSLGRSRNFDWMHVQACRL